MADILIKPHPQEDTYVLWSTIVDQPVWIGTRNEAGHHNLVTAEHLDRADKHGASGRTDEFGFNERDLAVRDLSDDGDSRRLPRKNLAAYARALDECHFEKALALAGPLR